MHALTLVGESEPGTPMPTDAPAPVMPPSPELPPGRVKLPPNEPSLPIREPGEVEPAQSQSLF